MMTGEADIWAKAILISLLIACCVVASIIDLRVRRLPNGINLLIFGSGIAFAALVDGAVGPSLLASALAWASLSGLAYAFRRWRGVTGLGGGDVKLLAACAPWVGIGGIAPALTIASLSALASIAVAALSGHSINRQTKIPFGPFLSLGAILVALLRVGGAGESLGVM